VKAHYRVSPPRFNPSAGSSPSPKSVSNEKRILLCGSSPQPLTHNIGRFKTTTRTSGFGKASGFVGTNPRRKPTCEFARRPGKVAEASGMAGSRLPMKPTLKGQDSLERMKLHAGSQSRNKPYRQDHGGDDPSPVAFDFGDLEFAAGYAQAIEQAPHPCQPGVATK